MESYFWANMYTWSKKYYYPRSHILQACRPLGPGFSEAHLLAVASVSLEDVPTMKYSGPAGRHGARGLFGRRNMVWIYQFSGCGE